MAGESNQAKWFGIRPTDPEEDIPVKQSDETKLNATVTQAAKDRTVTNATPANLKNEIHQPSTKEDFKTHGRIPSGATQVATASGAVNAVVTIYTVTAGKTLYLSQMTVTVMNDSGATQWYEVYINNASDVFQYVIISANDGNASITPACLSFNPPLEIPAGYKIKAATGHDDMYCNVFLHGYEI